MDFTGGFGAQRSRENVATLTYEMRTLPPDVLRVHLRRADACFVAVATAATTVDFAVSDELVQRRLRMPKRHFGGALRSLETTAPTHPCTTTNSTRHVGTAWGRAS